MVVVLLGVVLAYCLAEAEVGFFTLKPECANQLKALNPPPPPSPLPPPPSPSPLPQIKLLISHF